MVIARMDLREKIPADIVRGAALESTMNDLFHNFEAGEQRNAELVNRFFDQKYFRGEESLINKLLENDPNLSFDDIKDEGVNLAILEYNKLQWDFKGCLNKITSNNIKSAFIQKIFENIRIKLGGVPGGAVPRPYDDFDRECAIPGDTNVLGYFEKVVNYITSKGGNQEKTIEILKDVTITNEQLNGLLPAGEQIPAGMTLNNPAIPANTRNNFDTLLSFEIGKEADRTMSIAENFSKNIQGLRTNSLPAINTIVGESDEYKYDESKLSSTYPEYEGRLQTIRNNVNLSEKEKSDQINELRWEFYLQYLKAKNSKIGNALEQLYNNDFDYSKLDNNVLKDYFDRVADIRLKMLFDEGMNEFIKINWGNIDEFKHFYKNLTDPSKRNMVLNNVSVVAPGGTTLASVIVPIQKKLVEGKNLRLKEIDQFGKDSKKPYDVFPMEFTIKKSDIDALDITMEDKTKLLNLLSKFDQGDNYEIKGEDIGILIYLFFVINDAFRITEMNPENQKKVENLFGKAKNTEVRNNQEENNEGYTPEKFKEEIEKFGPGKFENGSEIWLPMGKSELPGGGYQWMKTKISKINMREGTFKGTVYGGELKFSSKLEGKSREFKMDEKTIEEFKKISQDSNKIWLQPNPDSSDFNSFRNSLNNRLGTTELSFPTAGITWTGDKFMQKIVDDKGNEKEVEVKYFGAPADDTSIYKIEYNPIRRSFTVSSTFNGEEKGKNGESEKKRFSYKRDMDWNNFLIFFTQKGLVPQTEEEANDAVARQDNEFKMVNGGHWKLNWFSFNNIKNVFKTIKGNIKKKMDDYNKTQDEKLEDILVGDWGLYGGLANVLGFIPSMKEGLGQLQQEYYNDRDNKTWKKIEYYLKIFQSDPDFGTTFEQVPPFARILGGKSYKQFIDDLNKPNISRSKDDIHKAAALLLANIEKGSSPYRGLAGKENSGLWVRVLLGDAHYNQFMRDKQKCIYDLQGAGKEKDQIQDVLATCEMDYIINNVSGANGKLKYFGSHEKRGLPGKEGTDYIDNPSKRLLSDQFANKLKGSYKGRFNKSSVEEAFSKITHNDFNLAKEDFKRLLKSSRFPGAIANLKKMFLLAKNEEQKSEFQKYFLLYMLSGVLDVNGKKDLRKQTYQWAKTMGFLPGMLAKETCHSQKVATLLDDWSGGDFSRNIKSYFHEGDLKDGKLKIDALIGELDARWSVDKMNKFDNYSKSSFLSKHFPKDSVLDKLQKSAINTDIENIDNSLLDNPLVANSGGLLSNINVVDDRIAFKNGEFEGKDPDERQNRKAFWKNVKIEINLKKANNIEDVKLLLNQYFNWFRFSDREEIYKWIKTASHWKNEIGKEKFYENDEHIRDSMGIIGPKEIESIIRYAFKGHTMYNRFNGRLPDELNDVLDAFQNKFQEAFDNHMFEKPEIISNVFEIGNAENIKPYGLGSWKKYNRAVTGREYVIDDEEGGGDSDKKKKNRVKRNFTSGNFINKKIADMENSFKRLPDKQYKSYTNATVNDLMSRFYDDAA